MISVNLKKTKILIMLLSCVLIFGTCLLSVFKKFNKGLDFSGGLIIELKIEKDSFVVFNDYIKKDFNNEFKIIEKNVDGGGYYVLSFSIENLMNLESYLVKNKIFNASLNNVDVVPIVKNYIVDRINIFKKNNVSLEVVKVDLVGAIVSRGFVKDSLIAFNFAIFAIFVYILIRFSYKFAVASVLSLLYDVIITLGFVNLMDIEINLTMVTAFLTIIGYCINDKIVVFDRIRSNLEIHNNKKVFEIIDISVTEVLTRSILTSVATIIATASLLFFQDKIIQEFGLTVICGIVVGTFSSIFVGSNILLLLKLEKFNLLKKEKDPMFYAS